MITATKKIGRMRLKVKMTKLLEKLLNVIKSNRDSKISVKTSLSTFHQSSMTTISFPRLLVT
jgi:hypothetical protein